MGENQKSGKALVIAIIVLCVLLFAETLFICINMNKITNNSADSNIEIDEKNESEKEEITDLDIKSSLVSELYGYIPQYNVNMSQENAYQSSKTTVESLNNSFLLAHAFRRIEVPNEEKEIVAGDYNDGWYKFNPDILQAEVKKIYGRELPNESFNIGAGSSCLFEDGKYQYGYGGGSGMGSSNIRKIDKAYIQGDKLYIEDEYLYIENIGYGEETGTFIYETSDKSNLVAKYTFETSLAGQGVVENLNNMKKYKHTFQKGEYDNYYWLSTEPIAK